MSDQPVKGSKFADMHCYDTAQIKSGVSYFKLPTAPYAYVLNRAGQSVADLPVAAAAAAADGGAHDVDLSLASLAPGEYLVEFTVARAGEPVKELVGFRITG